MGTSDDGLYPAFGSVLIGAGDNTFNTQPTDIVGNPRIYGSTIDVGAYETQTCLNTSQFTDSGWSNGIPTDRDTQAIFSTDYTTSAGNITACECNVQAGNTVTVEAGGYLDIQGNILVDGNLIVDHEGSVVQTSDAATVTNNGSIQVIKTTPVATGNSFSILGSPMSGTTRDGTFVDNNVVMRHDTNLFNLDPTVTVVNMGAEHFADTEGDNWLFLTGSENINPSQGYLVGPTTASVGSGFYNLNYSQGTLNNGIYNYDVVYNNIGTTSENRSNSPNIISNPYASAIDADIFLNDNNLINEVYFWEHLTPPNSSYPGYRSENWSMGDISLYNLSGGVAAPNGGVAPTQFIPSGQGFGVKVNNLGTITFNNAMRVTGNNTGYRSPENTNKIYLKVNNETYNLKSTMLVNFNPLASDGFEPAYDSNRLATPVSIYSVVDDKELAIQGRSVFTTQQVVPLGFRTMVEEEQTYTISLGEIEGENILDANVYLEDNLLHTVTNLSEENYTFTSNESNQKDRFVLVFTEKVLGTNNVALSNISIYPNPTKDVLYFVSPNSKIIGIEINDLRGRIINKMTVFFQNQFKIETSQLNSAVYFVKIKTTKGSITKKIVKE